MVERYRPNRVFQLSAAGFWYPTILLKLIYGPAFWQLLVPAEIGATVEFAGSKLFLARLELSNIKGTDLLFSQATLKTAVNSIRPESIRDLTDGRPRNRPEQLPGSGRIGAVLVLIYLDHLANQKVVLTKRRHNLKHHPGQISLPGGRQDPGETLQMTSLREAQEEIGIDPNQINILGELGRVYIPPSDYTITPFVGWCETAVQFVKCNDEVEEVMMVDLSDLMAPDTLKFGKIHSEPGNVEASYFSICGHQIWGATAVVLNDLVESIRHAAGT